MPTGDTWQTCDDYSSLTHDNLAVGCRDFRGSLALFLRENGQNSCRLKFQGFNNKVKASIAMAQQRLDVLVRPISLGGR